MVVIDARIPRFSQAIQAVVLAAAWLADARLVVPVLGAVLAIAVVGGPDWNIFARIYRALPIPPGELEPAAPPRFAQAVGAVFLGAASAGLALLDPGSRPWWILGWGPALAVAVLAALAATTSF